MTYERETRKQERQQTIGEEIANAVTHGVGLILAIIGLVVLLARAYAYGEPVHLVSCAVYGATLVVLYAASTLYHSVQSARFKRWLRIFDHTAIYLLIAGTYTPFTLVALDGGWGWAIFSAVWGLALVGILYKLFAFGRFRRLSLALYLAMGWLAVVAIGPLWESLPTGALALVGAGGVAYTAGVVFYALPKRFFHTIWHVCVMSGSAFHYAAVLIFLVPASPAG
ncbi:MAG: PAQR family membrane homeostasis protein TrhA [Persicimonas sp.]